MGTVSGKGITVKRRRYSRKFQRMAVERLRTCEDVGELVRELAVTRRCLYKWRTKLEVVEPGEEASRPSTHTACYRKEIQQLKRLLAEKKWIFSKVPCKKSRLDTRSAATLARWHLRANT